MLKSLAGLILKLLGWTLIEPPGRPRRAVVIAYPHTSNWDAFYALLAKLALSLGAHWVGKDSMFRWPFAGLLRAIGGIPVNRRSRTGFVVQMAEEFATRADLLLTIAPEGTRGLTPGWKTGFYRIARAAGVPVALSFVDYSRRELGILAWLELTGDPGRDLAAIAECYAGREGKHPELASPIRWLDQADN
jgi:1-acyl-sn-glycerol-3-phosphate acyltransferase